MPPGINRASLLPSMNYIRAAAVQFTHVNGDKDANMTTIRRFVEQAAESAVTLTVFPEMCITGYWALRHYTRAQLVDLAENVPEGSSSQTLLDLAARFNMTIGTGLIEIDVNGKLYNTYVVTMPDGRVASHRKLHCFINKNMDSGDSYTVFDMPNGCRAGILICYDNNIVENARINALMGAEILIAPHQTGGCLSRSPRAMGRIDPALWAQRFDNPEAVETVFRGPKGRGWLMRWLPARAHDNGMFLVFSNGVGVDDDEVRTGNAMILDPYGEILAETWRAGDDIVIADLDAGCLELSTGRRWLQARRPELYDPLTKATGREKSTRSVRFS